MSLKPLIVRVAVPTPLYQFFDYIVVDATTADQLPPVGARVRVPFRRRELVGIVVAAPVDSEFDHQKLKAVLECIDQESVLSADVLHLVQWMSSYYVCPPGQVYDLVLPKRLRDGLAVLPVGETIWRASTLGQKVELLSLQRARVQHAVMQYAQQNGHFSRQQAQQFGSSWRQAVKALLAKDYLTEHEEVPDISLPTAVDSTQQAPLHLTQEQQHIVDRIAPTEGFAVHLIHGVTGSGKTEVYLQLVEQVLAKGQQALLLVPEIGLTPQFVARVQSRLLARVAVVHSSLSDHERHTAWWHAQNGTADIILGTRASVFTAFDNLGIIVVDEEHDASFKQQDGVRYHARDVAIVRAKKLGVPIILGSATPSFESYHNALTGKYRLWEMQLRATGMELPTVHIVNVDKTQTDADFAKHGFSTMLKKQIEARLAKQQQSILYINRRGFAPTLYCPECGWIATCQRCDAHLTYHHSNVHSASMQVRCHHCGYQAQHSKTCPSCHRSELLPVGQGTQRVEESVKTLFPQARVLRLDRDSVSKKGAFDEKLAAIRGGEVDIILGTQMLTKGHDFPNVTLVGVLNADQGLYSADFRGPEQMFQQVLQVAGRAGRHQAGAVVIQTGFPEHPIFAQLVTQDYVAFAQQSIEERQLFAYPPFNHVALLRAESVVASEGLNFLRWCRGVALEVAQGEQQKEDQSMVAISDPVAAPMEKRAGRYRAQLLLKSSSRTNLHQVLQALITQVVNNPQSRRVRWSLDVDPMEMY